MATKNLSKVYSAELEGIDAKLIEVEVDINVGLHSFTIVGLPDKALNEARERVNSALKNSGARPPNRENRRITVNLAPADVKKRGAQYDLAIAIGYLLSTGQMRPFDARGKLFIGELALDGRLRPVNGALNIAEAARDLGFEYLFLPRGNAAEAGAIEGLGIFPLEKLSDALRLLGAPLTMTMSVRAHDADPGADADPDADADAGTAPRASETICSADSAPPDLEAIVGQASAKRAIVIAAAGGHNILLTGVPGIGKSMLARALGGILPPLSPREAIEATKIWSAAGQGSGALVAHRPFRAPHHTASMIALVGGGQDPRPGEASLAHRGVLFLDELPEFPRRALEALREPLESGAIRISRARHRLVFPARFALVAAMNPCPCGYYGDTEKACSCAAYEVLQYQKKVSGPLLDRIDLQIKVGRVAVGELTRDLDGGASVGGGRGGKAHDRRGITTRAAREAVARARHIQEARFAKMSGALRAVNSEMNSEEARANVALDPGARRFLASLDGAPLSPRAYYRALTVARTIADLDEKENVSAEHLAEALSYRLPDL